MDIKANLENLKEAIMGGKPEVPENPEIPTAPNEQLKEEIKPIENNVFNPKDIDPDLDVSEMPVGTQILAKGTNYTLNKEKMLVK